MQIVIDISEADYGEIKGIFADLQVYLEENAMDNFLNLGLRIQNAVYHGTPLPDDAIIIDAKEQSDYVFVEKAKYNDLVEAASKALIDQIKKSLHEGVTAESEAESEDKE
jgi:hypothetical protein